MPLSSSEAFSPLSTIVGDTVKNLGTIKNADLVEVAACEPDIIFIGGRLSSVYDSLSAIAPVIYLATDTEKGVVQSTADNAKTIASIFGLEDKIDDMVRGYDARIEAIKTEFGGKNAIVGLFSGSNYNVLGNDGRCSIIGVELGFNNMGVDAGELTSTHGNEASWETIVKLNPEYMFVMDRNTLLSSSAFCRRALFLLSDSIIQGYRQNEAVDEKTVVAVYRDGEYPF